MIVWLCTDASFREKSHVCGIGCQVLVGGKQYQWSTYEKKRLHLTASRDIGFILRNKTRYE